MHFLKPNKENKQFPKNLRPLSHLIVKSKIASGCIAARIKISRQINKERSNSIYFREIYW